jgi:uncharacterized membrane protein
MDIYIPLILNLLEVLIVILVIFGILVYSQYAFALAVFFLSLHVVDGQQSICSCTVQGYYLYM